MDFIRFIFSSVWIWLGLVCLIAVIFDGVVKLIKALLHRRTIKIYRFNGDNPKAKVVTEIENATAADVERLTQEASDGD